MTAKEQILYWACVNYHPLYEQYLLEEYEDRHGPHFDEEKAKCVVDEMFSADIDGTERKGEHWTIEEVRSVTKDYDFSDGTTCWDKYVALNSWWHDMRHEFSSDSLLIRAGIRFYFMDDDAPDGKIWTYMQAMKA